MDRQKWLDKRDSRTLRYSDRRLDPKRWIIISTDTDYATTFEGQVAVLISANLLSRMTPSVAISVPDTTLLAPLPWAGQPLHEFLLTQMRAADPEGHFAIRPPMDGDIILRLGPMGDGNVAHGSGWDAYLGPSPSPLSTNNSRPNPFGAALSAVLAVARHFAHDLEPPPFEFVCNALNWREARAPADTPPPSLDNIGKLWFVGTGSVGTATIYFLTLATRSFSAALFDMDEVKIHNLDRSPIFSAEDAEHKIKKVLATESYLRAVGVEDIVSEPCALDDAPLWRTRQSGTPDVLISAANERNVRSIIEAGFPQLQLYATTGKNWQTTLVRHVPLKDPCSTCLFPPQTVQPQTKCATGEVTEQVDNKEVKVDAALPFLSFAAGLMTAAELTKLQLLGYPYSPNRVFLHTQPEPSLVAVAMSYREGCACGARSARVHRKMLQNSHYARLSNEEVVGSRDATLQ